jgi:protease-4
LVDEIGGLREAINLAVNRANLQGKRWILEQYPEKRTPAQAFWEDLASGNEEEPVAKAAAVSTVSPVMQGNDPVARSVRQWQTEWRTLRSFNDPQGVYARLPFMLKL